MQTTADTVGIDNEIDGSFRRTLEVALRDLEYPVERFNDPISWLKECTGKLAVVAIPRRSSQDIRAMRSALQELVIVGACNVTPGPGAFRHYLTAGANGLITADQPQPELASTFVATLTGLVPMPTNVAQALACRLEEPPPRLELTARDREILRLVTQGTPLKQIAVATGYSDRHLRRVTSNLLRTIGATNRAHAAALTTRWGLNPSPACRLALVERTAVG